jgi:hypothetical protein
MSSADIRVKGCNVPWGDQMKKRETRRLQLALGARGGPKASTSCVATASVKVVSKIITISVGFSVIELMSWCEMIRVGSEMEQ